MSHLTKTALLVAIFGFVYVSAYQDVLKATLKDCKGGKEVTDADVEEFEKPRIPETEEERCLIACVLRAYNVVVDGHFDPKHFYGIAKNILHEAPDKLKQLKETLDYCGHEIPERMDNECDLAGEVMTCMTKYNKDHAFN